MRIFDAVLKLEPEAYQAYMGRAVALFGLERFEESLADYDAALERNAESAAAYAGRAQVKAKLERPMEAIADSSAALDLDPDLSGVAELRSDLQSQLAHLPDATVNFASNLRGGPDTDFPVIGLKHNGDRVKPFARTADDQWIKLAQGAWIHAALLNDVSLDLPLAQQIPSVPGESDTAPEVSLTITDYFNQGLEQSKAKKHPQAVAAYEKALLLESENAAVFGSLGGGQSFLGRVCGSYLRI